MGPDSLLIEKARWGHAPQGDVDLYTLRHGLMCLRVSTLGAAVVGLEVPVSLHGSDTVDVVLGYDSVEEYLRDECYFGCIVGRVANRISGATFTLDDRLYALDRNAGRHHLHGGSGGLHRRVWRAEAFETSEGPALRLEVTSPHGDMGYPGEVRMAAIYTLLEQGLRLELEYSADKPTPVNPASHMYFNLSGPGTICLEHVVRINASHALELDEDSIPTGKVLPVAGTPLDFLRERRVGESIDAPHPWTRIGQGFDQYFVFDGPENVGATKACPQCADQERVQDAAQSRESELVHAARAASPQGDRFLDVWTTCPGLQFYSGNFIPEGLPGKDGVRYPRRAGLCLECHGFVDAPNRHEFPGVTAKPGTVYKQRSDYRFSWK